MKKLFLLFFVALTFSGCAILKTVPLQKDSIVVVVEGESATALYEAIRFYVSETWNDPKHVTRYEEKSQNKISVSGVLYSETKSVGLGASAEKTIKGSLIFYVKDEKFKIVAKDLMTTQVTRNAYGNTNGQDSAPGIIPGHENILETYANDIKKLIKSETKTMDF